MSPQIAVSSYAALFERAAVIDYHTIAEELTHQGTCESAGGLLDLSELSLLTPSAAHVTSPGHARTE